jgi:hypothetical protein
MIPFPSDNSRFSSKQKRARHFIVIQQPHRFPNRNFVKSSLKHCRSISYRLKTLRYPYNHLRRSGKQTDQSSIEHKNSASHPNQNHTLTPSGISQLRRLKHPLESGLPLTSLKIWPVQTHRSIDLKNRDVYRLQSAARISMDLLDRNGTE